MEEKTSIEREISDVEARIRAEGNALKKVGNGYDYEKPGPTNGTNPSTLYQVHNSQRNMF